MRDLPDLIYALMYFGLFLMSLLVTVCGGIILVLGLYNVFAGVRSVPLVFLLGGATVLSLWVYGMVQFSKCSLGHIKACSFYSTMRLNRYMSSNPKLGLTLGFVLFIAGLLWSPFMTWLTMSYPVVVPVDVREFE